MLPLLSALLFFAYARVTELQSSAPQPVNFRLSDLKDGVIAMVFNKKWTYNRLSQIRPRTTDLNNRACMFYNGPANRTQLWKLTTSLYGDGSFLINNYEHPENRWAYNPHFGAFCYAKGIYQDAAWLFHPLSKNSTDFTVENSLNKGCYMQVTGNNAAAWNQKLPQKSQTDVKCGNVVGDGGVFNIKSPFNAMSNWHIVDLFDNQSNEPVQYEFEFDHGFTETITRSIARTDSFSMTISITVSAMFFGTGFSNTDSWTVSHSVTSSYENAMSKTFLQKTKINYSVPPGERICLYQWGAQMSDVITQTGFGFQSALYKLKACGPTSLKTGMRLRELPKGKVYASA